MREIIKAEFVIFKETKFMEEEALEKTTTFI